MKPVVCAIGTTEPWSAAGLGLDVRALAELGVHPLLVVAAVSAQDPEGVAALHPVPLEILRAQFAALERAPVDAVRIGALPSLEAARATAEFVVRRGAPAVYDPAFGATAGGSLVVHGDEARMIAEALIPYVAVVTPNLDEAEVLLQRGVRDAGAQTSAARELVARGARAALVTGGHLPGERVRDVLCDARGEVDYEDARIARELRGTGCLLADALAAGLARGSELREAIVSARAFVREKLESSQTLLDAMRLA